MNLKLRESVNVRSFTFQKKVIEEALELIGRKRNYVDNDIKFVIMITFCNNLVENNLIIESLYNEENIESKMETIVEPFFKEQVLDKPEVKEIFDDVVYQVIAYMDREYDSRNYITGFIYDFLADLGDFTMEDIEKLLKGLMSLIPLGDTKNTAPKEEVKQSDEEIKKDVLKDIDNLKMKAFIEKFTRESQDKKEESTN